jgi:hypothetical protein
MKLFSQSFEATNVIINLKQSLQPDSLGYNLPQELPKFLYPKIIDGSLSLWDSPKKEIRISADALQSIEQSSGTDFTSIGNLFIHEIWELSKRYLDAKTIGFTFINKTEKGSVSYGFIDYKDVMVMLGKFNIPSNANGFVNVTFKEAIQSKQFNFSIVQFGADNFKNNPGEAFEIQKRIFNNPKVKLFNGPKNVARYKLVAYEINRNGSENNQALFSSLTNYFKENLEQFFNLGGEEVISFLKKNPDIKITKMSVIERYKLDKGVVTSEILSVQFFVNGKYLKETELTELREIGATINFKPLETFIMEKEFVYKITFINQEATSDLNEAEIMQKIKQGKWRQLVKH